MDAVSTALVFLMILGLLLGALSVGYALGRRSAEERLNGERTDANADTTLVVPARVGTDGRIPRKAYDNDGAADLYAAEDVTLKPGERSLVTTRLKIALPDGYAAFVLPRSGLAVKHGIGHVNGPGLIDAGFRGEVGVILINHGEEPFEVRTGDRIAQLMVVPVLNWRLQEVDVLPEGSRGEGGFGSSGQR